MIETLHEQNENHTNPLYTISYKSFTEKINMGFFFFYEEDQDEYLKWFSYQVCSKSIQT